MEDFARASLRAKLRLQQGERLTVPQYHLVELLLKGTGSRPVGELAAAAGVTPPTATRMLDALERDGVVARVRDARDRRCVRVSLTPVGRRAAQRMRRLIQARRRRLFEALPSDIRQDATRVFQALAATVEEL
jgi:DNA-binding MarR family transcriptional regulator